MICDAWRVGTGKPSPEAMAIWRMCKLQFFGKYESNFGSERKSLDGVSGIVTLLCSVHAYIAYLISHRSGLNLATSLGYNNSSQLVQATSLDLKNGYVFSSNSTSQHSVRQVHNR